MALMNPGILPTPKQTYTPTDAALAAADEMAEPVTVRDYPTIYRLLIIANSVLWVAYFLGDSK